VAEARGRRRTSRAGAAGRAARAAADEPPGTADEPRDAVNWAGGTVARQVYLGSHRDYLVTLANGEAIRTIAPAELAIEKGQPVWLHFPPEQCRALAH